MLILISRCLDWIEGKIEKATWVDLPSLCCFRVIFGLFVMLFLWRKYSWIGSVPDAFFSPPMLSVAALFRGFPSASLLRLLDLAIGISTFTLTTGLFTRLSTILLLVLTVIGESFTFSFGKIDHSILYPCVLLAMSFQDWGAMFSIDALLGKQSASEYSKLKKKTANLSLLAVFIAFGFLTAGFGKGLSWIDLDLTTSGFLSWFYSGYYSNGRDQFLAPFVLNLVDRSFLWELIDISAVVFELGFLLAIWTRRSWYVWLTVACLFHLMNCLLLNIQFNANAAAYLAFVPWFQFPVVSYVFTKRSKWTLASVTAFGIFALVLREPMSGRASNVVSYLLESMDLGQGLVVSSGFWLVALLIFLLSFNKFVNLPQQRLRPSRIGGNAINRQVSQDQV